MSGHIKAKAQKAAMGCIPMIGEGPEYRQRLADFQAGYMAGHAAHTRWAHKVISDYRAARSARQTGEKP